MLSSLQFIEHMQSECSEYMIVNTNDYQIEQVQESENINHHQNIKTSNKKTKEIEK